MPVTAYDTKTRRNAWRRARYHGAQVCRFADGTYSWEWNHSTFGRFATRAEAKADCIRYFSSTHF